MKKLGIGLIILVIIIVIFVLAINQKNTSVEKQEINVALGSEPNSLDPAISLTIDVRSYLSNIFEGLVNINDKGEVKEGVAKKWESNDENTEYTFYLREDAKWSDGTQVTANDFKYAWLRVLKPETASGWASYLYYIKGAEKYNTGEGNPEDVGIDVIDDYTLKVTMESPCSFFTSMTALQPYYPVKENIINEFGEKWTQNANTYVSNGPFKLESWNHDSKITLIKNNNYWDTNKIKLSKINFILFSDSSAILNSYESGDLNYVGNMLTSEEMQQVAELKTSNFVYTKILAMNLNSNVFKDINVRKAISLALNRQEIANIMGVQMQPLTGLIPYGFHNVDENKDYTEDSNSTKYLQETSNIEEAKRLLEEAGYKDGQGLDKIIYLTNTTSSNIALAEIVKSQLSKIGLDIEIQALESKVFNTYRKEKKFDIVAASWAAEYPDITSYLYGFKSTDLNNYASFNNTEFDELYNKILSEKNSSQRLKLTHEAEDLVMNSYCVAPLYSEETSFIANDNLKGYYYDITGSLNFSRAYFD